MDVRISQYRLLVQDFAGCFRFYRDVLGLTVGFGSPDDIYADFALAEGQTLALFKRDLMAAAIGREDLSSQTGGQDTAVVVFQVENCDDAVKVLTANGAIFVAPPTDRPEWGMRTAHFRDPDGNLLEIFHSLPMPS